jgi:hypothetical protein
VGGVARRSAKVVSFPLIEGQFAMDKSKIIQHLDSRIEKFGGQLPTLESAMGAYLVGRRFGWKVLYLVHDKKTMRKYEDILGFRFRDELDPESDLSKKSLAFRLQKKITNFWKAVSGEMKVTYKGEERTARDKWIGPVS